MKRISLFCFLTLLGLFAAGCGSPAANAPANGTSNANANAKPVASAPTKESLFEMDKKANEAWMKGDKAHFEGMMSDKFVGFEQGGRMSKAEMVGMVGSFKCDVKSWSLDDPQMTKISDDVYAVVYKGTFDGSCAGPDGESQKIPSPTRAASIWMRDGDKWKGVYHGETMIIDPKAPPPAPEKPDAAKKEEPKKDEIASSNSTANSNTNAAPAPAKPTPGANTDALVKLHTGGFEAFKAKDAKWFDANLATNFALVGPMGDYVGTKADAIKLWTETMKCEGITKVGVADGFATSLSPTVEILTLKGTMDGTCEGQKNGGLYQTAVYVKEGDAWKLAFMFEAPAMN